MNPFQIIKDNIDIIKHVHFKDCSDNFEWKKMGQGDIEFPKIIQFLHDSDYNGWVMFEEETPEAALNPTKAIMDIGVYVEKNLKPIVKNN